MVIDRSAGELLDELRRLYEFQLEMLILNHDNDDDNDLCDFIFLIINFCNLSFAMFCTYDNNGYK